MFNIGDLMVTSLDTITAMSLSGDELLAILDELQNATISNTEDTQDITGKNGRKLNTLKRNKGVKISGTNGLLSSGLMAVQVGGEFAEKAKASVQWTERVAVTGGKAATTYKAVGTTGAEIMAVYMANADGSAGTKLTQDAAAAEGKFAYKPDTKELSFHTDVADGTEVIVIYMRNVKAGVLSNNSNKFAKKAHLFVDATAEDRCGNVFHVQIEVPKADFSGQFDMAFGDNQATHAFEAVSLAGACGAGGNLWNYTVFGANEGDAA